jgi:nucleoside-diphosphate-sugar epimerase
MTQIVLILGANGKIGSHAAEAFWNAGWQVRRYSRETDDITAAAMGADVIVNGLNPPHYHNWSGIIPRITRDVIAVARTSEATVILPGNIYNFGTVDGAIDPATPQNATTRKGRIRIEMEQAYRTSGVPTIVLRAGNFITPDGNGDIMSILMLKQANRRKVTALGRPDARQAYAYVPDWARAALALAERRADLPAFADIPFPGHCFTAADLRDALSHATGNRWRINRFPWWLMTACSPVWELAREFREMRYLFEMDHWIDGACFAKALPDFRQSPREEVMLAGLPADIHPDQAVRTGRQTVITQ